MKKKLLAVVLGLLLAPAVLLAENFTEEDGSPSTYPWKIKFTNGSLTDNADGTVSVDVTAGGGGTSLVDADADTKVQVEEGADDDTFRVDTFGVERLTIDSAGLMTYTSVVDAKGVEFNFDNALALGNSNPVFFTHDTGASAVTNSFTDPFFYIEIVRRYDAGTFTSADNYDAAHISRHGLCNDCTGVTYAGSVLHLGYDIEAGGTDTVNVLEIETDSDAEGNIIYTEIDTVGEVFSVSMNDFVVNEIGADRDTRFEGDNDNQLLRLDAGTDTIGIGTSNTDSKLRVVETDANNATISNVVGIVHNTTGVPGNGIGTQFYMGIETSTQTGQQATVLDTTWTDVTHATRTADFKISVTNSAVEQERMVMNSTETVFNDDQLDLDFRVESNNFANAINVNAGADSVTLGTDSLTIGNADGGQQIIAFDGDGGIDGNFRWDPTADIWIWNDSGADIDMRWEGDTNTELLFINAASEAIGISTVAPSALLDVQQGAAEGMTGLEVDCDDTDQTCMVVDGEQTTSNTIEVDSDLITTGDVLRLASDSNAVTTGFRMIDSQALGTAITADLGGAEAVNLFKVQRTNTAAAARSDNYDVVSIERTTNNTNAGGTNTQVGSVLNLLNSVSEDAGTTTDSTDVLTIIQDADSSGDGINISMNAAAGSALDIDHDHATVPAIIIDGETTTGTGVQFAYDALTTGEALKVVSFSPDANVRTVVQFTNDDAAADSARVLSIKQDGDADAIEIDQNGNGVGIDIQTDATSASAIDINSLNTTGNVIHVTASSLTTGAGVRVYSDSADVLERNLYSAVQDNAAAVLARGMYIGQDSTADGIEIDHNADGRAIHVDSEATTTNVFHLDATPLTTGHAIDISSLNNLTTGRALNIYSGSNDASARNLVNIYNDAGGDNTKVMYLRQDGDEITLQLDNNSSLSSALDIDSESTTVNAITVTAPASTTGHVISISDVDDLTTGNVFDVTSKAPSITSGRFLSMFYDTDATGAGAAASASKTGSFAHLEITRDHDDGVFAAADDFDAFRFIRETNQTGGGGTTTESGALVKMNHSVEAGVTSDVILFELTSDADSTGDTFDIEARSTGHGIDMEYQNSATNFAINITGDSSVTTTGGWLRVIDADGVDHTALEFQDEFVLAIDAEANGFSTFKADGSSGGCLMLRDTDDAGWTQCDVLNGVMTCAADDGDGVCD